MPMSLEAHITTLVRGAAETDSVAWSTTQESPRPMINLHLISEPADQSTHDGPNAYRECSVQIDVWDTDFNQLLTLFNKVRTLDGYRGNNGTVRALDQIAIRSRQDDDGDDLIYGRSIDFRVHYILDRN